MGERRLVSLIVIGIALATIGVHPLAATSYMPMADSALADQAALIVEVRVVGLSPSPDDVLISTDYTVEVERVLKGEPGGSTIVVRVPGGQHPSGMALTVFGAPVFEEGERALLFLRPKKRGHFAVEQLMLGAFHRVEAGRSVFWLRDLSAAHEVNLAARHSPSDAAGDHPRLAERFSSWLADRARGLRRPPDYRAAASATGLKSLRRAYRLYGPPNYRWFAFDERQPVRWWTSSAGLPGLPGGGHQEFQRAVAAWNDDPDTNVNLTYAGESATIGEFSYYGGMDGLNVVAFEFTELGTFRCGTGGLMSYSAVYTDWRSTRPFRGREVYDIKEGDIAIIQGVSCIFDREPDSTRGKIAEELFGHAIGHLLGLFDSSTDRGETNIAYREALMYGFLHADGRGARLTVDDRQGLRQLYGNQASGVCRPSAETLCLHKNRFVVEAFFSNPQNGQGGNGRAIRSTDAAGFFSFFGPANIELAVKILDFGDTFKVFYGQLTDFNFTLTVTDTKTGTVRAYESAGGDCSAVDPAAFASDARAHGTDAITAVTAPANGCKPGPNTLCFLGGRFRAEVDWHNQFNDTSGRGQMIRQSDFTGLVYYGDKSNLEMVVKVLELEGTAKVFYAPLSDLEYTLRVTELATQRTTIYRNGERESCGGQILATSPANGLAARP